MRSKTDETKLKLETYIIMNDNSDKILPQEIGCRLLQMFWHGLSWVRIQNVVTSMGKSSGVKNAGIWYTFQLHHYGKDKPEAFLAQLARHIYSDSHLES